MSDQLHDPDDHAEQMARYGEQKQRVLNARRFSSHIGEALDSLARFEFTGDPAHIDSAKGSMDAHDRPA